MFCCGRKRDKGEKDSNDSLTEAEEAELEKEEAELEASKKAAADAARSKPKVKKSARVFPHDASTSPGDVAHRLAELEQNQAKMMKMEAERLAVEKERLAIERERLDLERQDAPRRERHLQLKESKHGGMSPVTVHTSDSTRNLAARTGSPVPHSSPTVHQPPWLLNAPSYAHAHAGAGAVAEAEAMNKKTKVFISYCWLNSREQVKKDVEAGVADSSALERCGAFDPRSLLKIVRDAGYDVWLDVDRLQSGKMLPDQLAEALSEAACVIANISDEYAASGNCQKEFNFVENHQIPMVPVIVGMTQQQRKQKEAVLGSEKSYIDCRNEGEVEHKIKLILEAVKNVMGRREISMRALTAPPQSLTTIAEALAAGNVEACKRIIKASPEDVTKHFEQGKTALHLAVAKGNLGIVKTLLEAGADVDAKDQGGYTPVMCARDVEVIKCLVDGGADMHATNLHGSTVLHCLARGCFAASMEKLQDSPSFCSTDLKKPHVAELIHACVKHGADVEAKDSRDNTPILRSAIYGNIEAIRALNQDHAHTDVEDVHGWTLAHIAAHQADMAVIKCLVDLKVPLDCQSHSSLETPLHLACGSAEFDMVKLLCELSPASLGKVDMLGTNVLQVAAKRDDVKLLDYLSSRTPKSVTVDTPDKDGWTCLHFAVAFGAVNVFWHLSSRNKGLDVKTKDGRTLIHQACHFERLDMLKYLLPLMPPTINLATGDDEGWTAVHFAAKAGSIPILQYLLSKSCPLTTATPDGLNVLHIASVMGKVEALRFLLSKVPDPAALLAASDGLGWSCVHFAARSGSKDVMEALLRAGAGLKSRTADGRNVLHVACQNKRLDLLRYLVPGKLPSSTLNSGSNSKWTCLFYAVSAGSADVVRFLISAGAALDHRDGDGTNILHVAAFYGSKELLSILIPLSPSTVTIEAADAEGCTALFHATRGGHVEAVKYLVEMGGSLKKRDKAGRNLLHVAAMNNHLQMLQHLMKIMPKSINVRTEDEDGANCLELAKKVGATDVEEYLQSHQS
ncbi:hypothetical protein HK101_008470 [Irineochytrium annulatum]|nr:hypothetical protein HK101_008470 [Irineochytrium annulatum]